MHLIASDHMHRIASDHMHRIASDNMDRIASDHMHRIALVATKQLRNFAPTKESIDWVLTLGKTVYKIVQIMLDLSLQTDAYGPMRFLCPTCLVATKQLSVHKKDLNDFGNSFAQCEYPIYTIFSGCEIYDLCSPKRRFWRPEQSVPCAFLKHFSRM